MKVWLWGPVFRHDRPQAGRYREFHQFDCEIMGERDPILDAETIVVAYNFLRDLGVETRIDVNSIGTREDRERYTIELVGFLRTKRSYLCEDCKRRLVKNPLRVLDCKETQCASVVEEAPQIIDWLSDASKNYFMKVLEYLDEIGIPYMLRPTLVRGLDYYTDTVFEIYPEQPVLPQPAEGSVADGEADVSAQLPAQAALGGGGRYDLLVEQLGGRPTPACGFAIGLERVATMIKRDAQGVSKPIQGKKRVYLAQLGEQARRKALHIIEDLRRFGVVISHDLSKASLKTQLELANKIGATHTLIIGQKEVQDGTVIIRDMESGIQEIIDQKKVTSEVKKMLES
jgi:histidyl-tRNA synthetase